MFPLYTTLKNRMATTLTVDQAVQRLLHGGTRTNNDTRLMTVSTTPNLGQRGNAVAAGIFVTEKSPGSNRVRNGGNSRFSDEGTVGMNTSRVSGDQYFLNSLHRRTKSNSGHGNGAVGEGEAINQVASTGSVDVQRCLKNIIVSQANILNQQKQITAAKDREIEDLKRENNALKYALRSLEKRFPTTNAAQQCDFSDFADHKHATTNGDHGKMCSTPATLHLENGDHGSAIKRDFDQKNLSSKRTRQHRRSSDNLVLHDSASLRTGSMGGILRSGRRRATLEEDTDPQPKKKRPRNDDVEMAPERVTRKGSSLKQGKSRSSINSSEVQTPEWRITSYSAGGVLEGTENITDEAFSKRHQKCEVEERRVIRRDRMRQREEFLKEKLIKAEHQNRIAKQKRDRNDSESSTTEHNVDEIEAIEICDHLPKDSASKLPDIPATTPSRKKAKSRKK